MIGAGSNEEGEEALAEAYNDAASAAHVRHPERFVGLAMVNALGVTNYLFPNSWRN